MKPFLAILFLSFACHGQSLMPLYFPVTFTNVDFRTHSPPMPIAVHATVIKPHGCTNCPPPIVYVKNGKMGLTWTPSKSPGIAAQNVCRSPSFVNPVWKVDQTFGPTQATCIVQVTNPAIGYFAVQSVPSNGAPSLLP